MAKIEQLLRDILFAPFRLLRLGAIELGRTLRALPMEFLRLLPPLIALAAVAAILWWIFKG